MLKNKLTIALILVFLAIPLSIGILAYMHNEESEKSYSEQQAALSKFAKSNVELCVATGKIDEVKNTLNWLQNYSIFEGAILYDEEMTPLLKIPSEFEIDTIILKKTITNSEYSEKNITSHFVKFQDDDGELIGNFLIVFTLEEVRAEQKWALFKTALITNIIILPLLIILAFMAKRQEKSLDYSLQLQASITKHAMDAIIAIDKFGSITDFNPTAEKIFGHKREDIISKNWSKLLLPSKERKFEFRDLDNNSDKLISKIVGRRFEIEVVNSLGNKFPAELSVTQVESENGQTAVIFVRDLTTQKKSEDELRNLESRLRTTQKMEAIGTLAGGIAHDFNNILGGILGHSDLALMDVTKNEKQWKRLQQIKQAALRAKDLVKQILTFSRQADVSLQPTFIKNVIMEAIDLVKSTLPSTIDIKFYCEKNNSEITVLVDPIQIHQVLMNMCTNSSHAIGNNQGKIDISLDSVAVEKDFSNNSLLLEKNNYARLTFADNGCGMDEETITRIFDPFFTTKEVGKGTGLGLSTVHGIIKGYRGGLAVHSTVGKGTTFEIYLPLVELPEDSSDELRQFSLGGYDKNYSDSEKNLRILLVDDEEILIDVCTQMLEKLGHSVKSFLSSTDALNEFRNNPLLYDLIITDQTMPSMTGDILIKEIFKIRPELLVIMTSGFSDTVTPNMIEQLGVKVFLPKPVTLKELADGIHKATNSSKESQHC